MTLPIFMQSNDCRIRVSSSTVIPMGYTANGTNISFSGFSVGCCIERRLSVTNLSSENNFADISTECSSRHLGESERSAKQRCYL